MYRTRNQSILIAIFVSVLLTLSAQAQNAGILHGKVLLESNGAPLHKASVLIVETGEVAVSDDQGIYTFDSLAPGVYTVVAYSASLRSETELVEVTAGGTVERDFQVRVPVLKQEIVVTAKGSQETAFQSVQSVHSLDNIDLSERMATSLGDVLDGEPGVAKRSFGPGTSRPVVRGFDGDRVLVMQDGLRLGSLGSQSGDHGEPIDPSSVDRVEVLRGPATLLYGSNAVGGVVNAVTGLYDVRKQPHDGTRAQISSAAGSNNGLAGGNASGEFGYRNWLFWVGGGGQRAGDYSSPQGIVPHSDSRVANTKAGLGWYGPKAFAAFGYTLFDGHYGIPFAAELESGTIGAPQGGEEGAGEEPPAEEEEELDSINIDMKRHDLRLAGGFRELGGPISHIGFSLGYARYDHQEVETLADGEQNVGTAFKNNQIVYRGVFEQSPRGALSGSFGFWGLSRNYQSNGEEALSPPVDQTAFALFALEEVQLEGVKLQFGGRIDRTNYQVKGLFDREGEEVLLPDRAFTGASGGLGARFDLWKGGAFVANFTSSHRSPSLEELYNFGPHGGNRTFEMGDPNLGKEHSNGFDFSLRQESDRIRAEANFFVYFINNFVFLAPTGGIEDNLIAADYLQDDARFLGGELRLNVGLTDHFWLNFGLDKVNAELTDQNRPLPRIPPLRGRIGFDLRCKNFSFRPELVAVDQQDQVFDTETRTGGYAVTNLTASYTRASTHLIHHFAFEVFNVGDKLYRNHLSFIKDFAPEMGRGARLSYVMNFF